MGGLATKKSNPQAAQMMGRGMLLLTKVHRMPKLEGRDDSICPGIKKQDWPRILIRELSISLQLAADFVMIQPCTLGTVLNCDPGP